MLKHIYYIYGLMLIALVNCAEGRASLHLINITCTSFDETVLVFEICELPIAKETNRTSLSVRMNLLKEIRNATLHVVINKVGKSNGQNLVEFKSNICAFMKNKRRNLLAQLMYLAIGFDKYSNINHTCPYKGMVYMQSPGFNDRMLKLLGIPIGKYVFNMKVVLNKDIRINYVVVFERKEEET